VAEKVAATTLRMAPLGSRRQTGAIDPVQSAIMDGLLPR
jgi:hypothetical protein